MLFKDFPHLSQYCIDNGWKFWRRGGWLTVVQHEGGITEVWWTPRCSNNGFADRIIGISVDNSGKLLSYSYKEENEKINVVWSSSGNVEKDRYYNEEKSKGWGIKFATQMHELLTKAEIKCQLTGSRNRIFGADQLFS